MSNLPSQRSHRFSILVGAAALMLAAPALSDSALPPSERSPSISIDSSGVRPSRLRLASNQHLVFYNDSDAVARVELELEHGSGLNCVGVNGEVLHGRKFVVPAASALDCEAPLTNVDYRVFRTGSSSVAKSEGRIELDRGER